VKALAFALYFFGLGYLTRKTGLDRRLMARIDTGLDTLAGRLGEEFGSAFSEALGVPPELMADLAGTGHGE
jgi:hypothetical protein